MGKAQKCWSFGQVESRLETIYGTFALGAHVVIAHELFHSVQDAYDANLDRFWAEGTAQWAAKTIYPAEKDFESFLPSFFKQAGNSIDISGGGVVADYLYGSAVWPAFLTQHFGPTAVPGAFMQEGQLGPPSMAAIGASLPALGSSLADAYPTFAAWNAGTGARAGTGGYTDAAAYPMVTLTPFPAAGTVSDIVTGYSVFFYSYDFGATTQTLTPRRGRDAARGADLPAGRGEGGARQADDPPGDGDRRGGGRGGGHLGEEERCPVHADGGRRRWPTRGRAAAAARRGPPRRAGGARPGRARGEGRGWWRSCCSQAPEGGGG